jgi:dihydroflavonol-4-reductase
MKTLITGASGFVGSAVLRLLLETRHEVRALVRPSSLRANLEGLTLEIVEGDLNDPASLEHALQGCEALYHVAADYRLWTPTPQTLYQNNVTGTRNIMRAAGNAGVKRIVYTSSVATLGLDRAGAPANEDIPVTLEHMIGHYKRSKFLAEAEVRRLVENEGLPVVIVNPSAPVGPRDIKPTPTGRLIRDAARGQMPAYVDTGLNIVHVDDVADGHLQAFARGRIGERYILGGEDMTLRQILEAMAAITGRPAPRIRLPHNVVLPVAYLTETWARITRRGEPRVTIDGVRMAKKKMFFTSAKAKRELGYSPRPALEALRDAVLWFRTNGGF